MAIMKKVFKEIPEICYAPYSRSNVEERESCERPLIGIHTIYTKSCACALVPVLIEVCARPSMQTRRLFYVT